MDGGQSQRTFVYIKDAIEAVLLMIVSGPSFLSLSDSTFSLLGKKKKRLLNTMIFSQDNPARANGHIFNVGNPNNEVTVRQLAEMMTEVNKPLVYLMQY